MAFTFMEIWLITLIFLTGIIILVVTLQLNTALNNLVKQSSHLIKQEASWWEKFKGLKPLDREQDLLMKHTYDGIAELDNPTPPWFMYLFYSSIIFGLIYGAYYHVYQDGNIQETEYKTEVIAAEKARESYMKQFAQTINEENAKVLSTVKDLTKGSQIYSMNCVACHGDKGQGGVGPNLTDKFWIHGGGIKDLFKTIKHGVPEKGMIAWEKSLNPIQIQQVASFVLTLQGTNPPGAKEPQGEEIN
jgi:cytochrome c oxidase cbb3-type subunit 3